MVDGWDSFCAAACDGVAREAVEDVGMVGDQRPFRLATRPRRLAKCTVKPALDFSGSCPLRRQFASCFSEKRTKSENYCRATAGRLCIPEIRAVSGSWAGICLSGAGAIRPASKSFYLDAIGFPSNESELHWPGKVRFRTSCPSNTATACRVGKLINVGECFGIPAFGA